jgi:methylthioribose-1-phosphate isomerase
MAIQTLAWRNHRLFLLDQTKLPLTEVYVPCSTYQQVAKAISKMVVRGAPAIGVAAAFGIVLGARQCGAQDPQAFLRQIEKVGQALLTTRPTAINLRWAIERLKAVARQNIGKGVRAVQMDLQEEALRILEEDIQVNRAIGRHGKILVKDGFSILTHCNAGALATAGYGTALGVIRAAYEAGKRIHVFIDETRPFLQGSRLTAWELQKERIPCTLIADNMAGALMAQGKIDLAIVGADRIAANGDVANKIGTYSVAVLCHVHRIPFYVAAPLSTVDLRTPSGKEIPIEHRREEEITTLGGKRLAPENIRVFNPAFDVTPHRYIQGIITEKGILRKPFRRNLPKIFSAEEKM